MQIKMPNVKFCFQISSSKIFYLFILLLTIFIFSSPFKIIKKHNLTIPITFPTRQCKSCLTSITASTSSPMTIITIIRTLYNNNSIHKQCIHSTYNKLDVIRGAHTAYFSESFYIRNQKP